NNPPATHKTHPVIAVAANRWTGDSEADPMPTPVKAYRPPAPVRYIRLLSPSPLSVPRYFCKFRPQRLAGHGFREAQTGVDRTPSAIRVRQDESTIRRTPLRRLALDQTRPTQ